MIRPALRFQPSPEELDKKTLLSAGQLAHLAHADHAAADTFKYYFRLKNLTGHNVRVLWSVNAIGSDSGSKDVPKNEMRTIISKPVDGGAGTVTVKYDGTQIYPSSVSRRDREPPPPESQIPLTDLR